MSLPIGSGLSFLIRGRNTRTPAQEAATPAGLRRSDREFPAARVRRLPESRPRATSLTRCGRVMTTIAVLLIVGAATGGPLLYGQLQRQARTRQTFLQNSVVTSGEVVQLRRNGDNNRRVTYRFVVDGRTFEGTAGVSSDRFRALSVGAPIRVRYLPGNPASHRLDGARGDGVPVAIAFVFPVMLGMVGGGLLLNVNRQRWLVTEGRAAQGVVTGMKARTSSHETKSFAVTYQFPLLDGRMATGKSTFNKNPPAVGTTVQVLYNPERPGRSAIYPSGCVRVAE
jgi:hypothetical protein